MRELDELLVGYLRGEYGRASEPEKGAFLRLLVLSDPDLIGYLLGNQKHDCPETAVVIEKIRRRTQT